MSWPSPETTRSSAHSARTSRSTKDRSGVKYPVPATGSILADDLMLARHLSDVAAGGSRLRHVNINYLVSPITNPRPAHAKLILLTDATGGTLLIGSGNVSIDGYASRGEAFCRYDISADSTTDLGAFQVAKDFLDTMAARGYLDAQAIQHLERMWSDAPWIWAPSAGGVQTVRHNLNTPLAEQLLAFVADEPVTDVVSARTVL